MIHKWDGSGCKSPSGCSGPSGERDVEPSAQARSEGGGANTAEDVSGFLIGPGSAGLSVSWGIKSAGGANDEMGQDNRCD